MTDEQKNQIVSLRYAGYGYTSVARNLGLTKSAVATYCHKIGLTGVRDKSQKDLISVLNRGNISDGESHASLENKGLEACRVTYKFANSSDEFEVNDILRILVQRGDDG